MKKNILTGIILMIIAAMSGLAISGINKVTSPIIEKNTQEKEIKLCKNIFSIYDSNNSQTTLSGFNNDAISKKVVAIDSNKAPLGVIYIVSGRNAYGPISLLVGISNDGKLVSVEFLENGQSFGNEVSNHVDNKYVNGLTLDNIEGIDTKCGATYGAKTVKELVSIAFADYNGGTK